MAATRGNVIMLLYNAIDTGGGKGTNGTSNIDDILQGLLDILEE